MNPMMAGHAIRLARARLALDGLSVGDAFGESFVLHRRAAGERRPGAPPPWRWTDDTAMALAVVDGLAADGDVVADTLAAGFARRYTAEPWRGYGATAQGLLEAIADGVPWRQAARAPFGGHGSKGNGAAMRAAPIGAYFADDLPRVVAAAITSSHPTHAHRDGEAGAVAVAVAAAIATRVGGAPSPADRAALLAAVYDHTPTSLTRDGIELACRLPPTTAVRDAAARLGNGSRVLCEDTVPLCVWLAARHLGDYHEALWETVAALGDLDTNAAIVGGIVAAGGAPIPPAWLAAREPLPA